MRVEPWWYPRRVVHSLPSNWLFRYLWYRMSLMPDNPNTIEFMADGFRINGPKIDGGYSITYTVGEYEASKLKAHMDIPIHTAIKVKVEANGDWCGLGSDLVVAACIVATNYNEKTMAKPVAGFNARPENINKNGRPPKGYSITEMFQEMFTKHPNRKLELGEMIFKEGTARRSDGYEADMELHGWHAHSTQRTHWSRW